MINTIIYLIAELFSKLSVFLLMPFIANILTIDDFGKFSFILPAIQYFQVVFAFGLTVSLSTLFFNKNNNHKELLFNVLIYWIVIGLFVYIIYKTLFSEFFVSSDYKSIIEYLIIYLYSMSLLLIVSQFYQLKKEALKFSFLYILPKFVMLLIVIYYYFFDLNLNLSELIYHFMIVAIIFGMISLFLLLKNSLIKVNTSYYKDFIIIGYPIVLNGVISYLVVVSGRAVILDIATLTDVAIFTVVQSVAQVITIFYAVVSRIVGIENYKRVAHNTLNDDYINSSFKLITKLLVLSLLIIASSTYYILLLIDKEVYFEYVTYIYILLFGYYFQVYYALLVDIIYANKKTFLITIMITFSVLFNILLVYFLFPRFGILGAVISQVLTICIQSIFVIIYVNKYHNISFSFIPLKSNLLILGFGLVILNLLGKNYMILNIVIIVLFIITIQELFRSKNIIIKNYQ